MTSPATWEKLCERLNHQFGSEPDLNGILFLVGIRERGLTIQKFTKEEKINLINLGSCTLYCELGLLEQVGKDHDGWPLFRQKSVAPFIAEELKQKTLQECAIRYFAKIFE